MSSSSSTSFESKNFPPTGADVIFVSSNRVKFGLHSKNLEVGSDGFPPVGTSPQEGVGLVANEPVALTEPSKVLNLLFSFLYPEKIPETLGDDFKIILALAEAAEKYQVHLAIRECKKQLRNFAKKSDFNDLKITAFSMKHRYLDLLDLTAPRTALRPLSEVVPHLPGEFITPWIKYHELWQDVHMSLPRMMAGCMFYQREVDDKSAACSTWTICLDEFLKRWYNYNSQELSPLIDLDHLFSPPVNSKLKDKKVFVRACCKKTLLARKKRAHEMVVGMLQIRFTEVWKARV